MACRRTSGPPPARCSQASSAQILASDQNHPGINITYLCLLSLLEESLLALLLLCLVLGEVALLADLINDSGVNTRHVDLLRCGNDVASVHAAERDTVGLEGTGDEENTLAEGLEEYNALAAETAGEEDEDGAGLEGWAELGWVLGLAGLRRSGLAGSHSTDSRCDANV